MTHRFFTSLVKCAAVFLLATAAAAQSTAATQPVMPLSTDLKKYPGLQAELVQLLNKLEHNVQLPPPRSQSHLLPLMPQSTVFYAAFPNYGDAAHQALNIFRQEKQQSPVLQDWWLHGDLASSGPKVEDSLDRFYQLSQYLGDEVVVSGASEGRQGPSLLVLAEVRKPGLKEFLQQMVKDLAGTSKPGVRIFDPQDLAAAKDTLPPQQPVVLVRQDFVAMALDLATLRSLNARLDQGGRPFAATAFGQRVAQAYEGGATTVGAANLQEVLKQIPPGNDPSRMMFQRSGFADMKYLVWEHKSGSGHAATQAELSFTGPRRGVASWLAAPAALGSLDFVSPSAILASTVRLKNLGEIFDDIQDLAAGSNPAAFSMLGQMQQGMGLSLKDDLLSHLAGEITFEIDSAAPPNPVWKAILRVHDADRLQATFDKLLATAPVKAEQSVEAGVTYHTLRIPSPQKAMEISYAFVDGYMVIASSHESLSEAIRIHRGGESLAKSSTFLAALPPGQSADASALFYEDPMAMMALQMQQMSPELATTLTQARGAATPSVVWAYGEPTAVREVSTSEGVDPGTVLVMAALAIPNLLRARVAANESAAVAALRTVETAQVLYSTTYPDRGYARDLATLGMGPGGPDAVSADHAGLIDAALVNPSCAGGAWCAKSGFQFRITAACRKQPCREFVVVGTPVTSNEGSRSFCSTTDGVIRFKLGPPLISPVSAAECQSWPPLQ